MGLPLRLLTTLVFVSWIGAISEARAEDQTGFTLYVDSGLAPQVAPRIRVDFGKVSLEELAANDTWRLIAPEAVDNQLVVYIPSGLSSVERIEFENLVNQQLEGKIASNVIRYYEIDVEEAAFRMAEANEDISASKPDGNSRTQAIATAMSEANLRTISLIRNWQESFHYCLRNYRKDPRAKDFILGSLSALGRSGVATVFYLTVTGVNPYGIGQVLLSHALNQLHTHFSQKIRSWKVTHQFPWFKHNPIVRFYNGRSFLKVWAWDQIHSTAAIVPFRLLSWLNDPERVASPASAEFIQSFALLGIAGGVINSFGNIGMHQLRQKGWIGSRIEFYASQVFAVLLQAQNLSLATGRYEFMPFIVGTMWTGRLLFGVAGRFLPYRRGRTLLIHPKIGKNGMAQIGYLESLTEAMTPEKIKTKIETESRYGPSLSAKIALSYQRFTALFSKVWQNHLRSTRGICSRLFQVGSND